MNDNKIRIVILEEIYSICRLEKNDTIPDDITKSNFYSITSSPKEIFLVCEQKFIRDGMKVEKDWKVLKIDSILDFSLIGIISKISTILADAKISIFVVSTYDTDYVLIKKSNLEITVRVLEENGYEIIKY